jgi:hypothetical protein
MKTARFLLPLEIEVITNNRKTPILGQSQGASVDNKCIYHIRISLGSSSL